MTCAVYFIDSLPPSLQVDQSLQTLHCKERQSNHLFTDEILSVCHIDIVSCILFSVARLLLCMCIPIHVVQRRAIVTALDVHRQDLDVTSLTSDLKGIGILTVEQSQKLVSLDDQEQRHEALLYSLLAHDGPDTFHKLVDCMGLRDTSTASDLQGVSICHV